MRSLHHFLLARKTVILLLSAITIACLLGSTIPQFGARSPAFFKAWQAENPWIYYLVDLLQLDQVFTSIWFLILILLTCCSLTATVYQQAQKALAKPAGLAGPNCSHFTVPACRPDLKKSLIDILRRHRYHLYFTEIKDEKECLVFSRNRLGRWGSTIFHLGLLCVLLASLYHSAFRQRGFIPLMEGQSFTSREQDWAASESGLLASELELPFALKLNRYQPVYGKNGSLQEATGQVTIIRENSPSNSHSLSINQPARIKKHKIFLAQDQGYALDLLLNKNSSEPVLSHVLLGPPQAGRKTVEEVIRLATTPYTLSLRFQPALKGSEAELGLTVQDPHSRLLLEGRMQPGQTALLPDGNTLTLQKAVPWTGLILTHSPGLTLLHLGLFLVIIGALLLYMLPFKVIILEIIPETGGWQVRAGGKAPKYQVLWAEELQEITRNLKLRVSKPWKQANYL